MSIALAVVTFALVAPGQRTEPSPWMYGNKVPGYKPVFTPSVLKGMSPKSVAIDEKRAIRGLQPILTHYVVKANFAKVAHSILKQMKPDRGFTDLTLEKLQNYRIAVASLTFPDRVIQATIMAGRPIVQGGGLNYTDYKTYTLVSFSERPLMVGSMPRAWPKVASSPPPLPKGFTGHPFTGIEKKPTSWYKDQGAGFGYYYHIDYMLKGKAEDLAPKLMAQLKGNRNWTKANPGLKDRFRISPADGRTSLITHMSFESGKSAFEEMPANWSRLSVQWVDAETTRPNPNQPRRIK